MSNMGNDFIGQNGKLTQATKNPNFPVSCKGRVVKDQNVCLENKVNSAILVKSTNPSYEKGGVKKDKQWSGKSVVATQNILIAKQGTIQTFSQNCHSSIRSASALQPI